MCEVPDSLAQPSSVLRFIFLVKIELASHQHHVERSYCDILSIFMGAVLCLPL